MAETLVNTAADDEFILMSGQPDNTFAPYPLATSFLFHQSSLLTKTFERAVAEWSAAALFSNLHRGLQLYYTDSMLISSPALQFVQPSGAKCFPQLCANDRNPHASVNQTKPFHALVSACSCFTTIWALNSTSASLNLTATEVYLGHNHSKISGRSSYKNTKYVKIISGREPDIPTYCAEHLIKNSGSCVSQNEINNLTHRK